MPSDSSQPQIYCKFLLQKSQEVEFIKQKYGQRYCKFFQEAEFINKYYRQKYCKNLLKKFQELKFINQHYRQKYCKFPKRHGYFLTKNILRNKNQLRMSQGRTGKIFASLGGTETIVRNRCSYQVPEMVGTNASTYENHKFYNSTVQVISRGGGDFSKKV